MIAMVQLFEVQRVFFQLLAIAPTPFRTIGRHSCNTVSDRAFNKSHGKNEWCVLCLHFRLITFHFYWQRIPFAEWIDWIRKNWKQKQQQQRHTKLMTEWFDFKRTTPNNFSLKRDLKSKYGIVWLCVCVCVCGWVFSFRSTIVGKSYNLWWVDRNMSFSMWAE